MQIFYCRSSDPVEIPPIFIKSSSGNKISTKLNIMTTRSEKWLAPGAAHMRVLGLSSHWTRDCVLAGPHFQMAPGHDVRRTTYMKV